MTNREIDNYKPQDKMQGYLVVTRHFKDGSEKRETIENLVVAKAREIVRNLVFGDVETIKGLSLGDGNVPPDKALIKDAVGTPSIVDVALVNRTFTATIVSKEKLVFEERPAIKYSFFIDYNEGNGAGDGANNYYTEAGLTLEDGTLFTRLTFRALSKDSTSALSLDYYLLF